ncbi:hypothetical protein RRG08_004724 [Elysia crispata]|uniref:Uncharacterized protein n=1 Tax=Elysia crispata TaxID=231223 RepID=A0AAE0YFJ8_9GAST|nr:hypothetical protein RRG08_004724 [Elysia crispata]
MEKQFVSPLMYALVRWGTSLCHLRCALQIDGDLVCVSCDVRSKLIENQFVSPVILMENQFDVRSRLMENQFDVRSRLMENQFDVRSRLMENQFGVPPRLMENQFHVRSRLMGNQFVSPALCAPD